MTANLSPTAQLEGWLPPPTPASGRSLLQVPAARVKINQHPPASCEQEKISPEEGALGHLPSDEERRPLYQAVIIAWAFNLDILEITLWVGGAQRQKKREATATLNETIAQGFFLWRFPTHQRRNFVWCRAAEELWLSIFAQSTDKWHHGWDSSPGAKVIMHVQQQVPLMQCFKSRPIIWPSLHSSYTRHAHIYHAFCYGFCGLDSMAQEVSSSFVSSKIIQNQRVFSWDGNWILTSHLMLLCITPPTTLSRYILTS